MPIQKAKVQSIARAAALLEAMGDGKWATLKTLAETIGLARTTTFTLVHSLVEVGLAEHDVKGGAYRLGLQHLSYGRAVERRLEIANAARPILVELCAATGETVNLALPQTMDALFVESLEGTQGVRVTSYSGQRAPYHATACGRALMAFWDEKRRKEFYAAAQLGKLTPNTIIDPDVLESVLATCRERGWTMEIEETELGASCVAAPILTMHGDVIASVSIAGPAVRMSEARISQIAALLISSLQRVEKRLSG